MKFHPPLAGRPEISVAFSFTQPFHTPFRDVPKRSPRARREAPGPQSQTWIRCRRRPRSSCCLRTPAATTKQVARASVASTSTALRCMIDVTAWAPAAVVRIYPPAEQQHRIQWALEGAPAMVVQPSQQHHEAAAASLRMPRREMRALNSVQVLPKPLMIYRRSSSNRGVGRLGT